jgi:ABC-2 type transport system permease protein
MSGRALLRALQAQARVELLLTLRRGENVLVTLVIPPALLLFFGAVAVLPTDGQEPVRFLLPGLLALAVISTSLVSLGIATAYERHYGVLKLLGGTPLPRGALVGAKLLAVLALEAAQVVLLVGVAALAFGWRPGGPAAGSPGGPEAAWSALALTALTLLLGTAAFAGLGLLLAGTLRAEATLALANGLYLLFLLLGGTVFPLERLPGPLAAFARLLPAAALSDALRAALSPGAPPPLGALALLAAWAAATVGAASRTFRWE